jgi:hypothetical protein
METVPEEPRVPLRDLFRTYLNEDDSLDGIELRKAPAPAPVVVVAEPVAMKPVDTTVSDVMVQFFFCLSSFPLFFVVTAVSGTTRTLCLLGW